MNDARRQTEDAPSSSMGLSPPLVAPRSLVVSGEKTRVVAEQVPGGVTIHASPSPGTRLAWFGGTLFFAAPTLGAWGAGLAGLMLVGKFAGAVIAAVCLPAAVALTLATYRAACIALNTTHVDADARHLVVRSTPLPMLRWLDMKTEQIDAFDVVWQGGARDDKGAFWAILIVLDGGERRPLVQNLSQNDALALRASLESALGRASTRRGPD